MSNHMLNVDMTEISIDWANKVLESVLEKFIQCHSLKILLPDISRKI